MTINITIYLEYITIYEVDLVDRTIYLVRNHDIYIPGTYNDTYLPGKSLRAETFPGLYHLVHVVEWKPDTCMVFKRVLPGLDVQHLI